MCPFPKDSNIYNCNITVYILILWWDWKLGNALIQFLTFFEGGSNTVFGMLQRGKSDNLIACIS